jgi:hypothetical protein
MASSVSKPDLRTQLNSVRGHSVKVSEPSQGMRTNANRAEFLRLIRLSMKDAGMSQKEMAINAGCTESQLADGLNGVRNFSADWLWEQPNSFWLKLRDHVDAAKGLTVENRRALAAERIGELVKLLIEQAVA